MSYSRIEDEIEMETAVGIAILNYKAFHETIKCVASIRNTIRELYQIVIVDNGSGNGSYEYLERHYQGQAAIDVIQSKQNVGFAKGNNIGIKHLQDKYCSEFILLLNSDTIMVDRDYMQKLLRQYREAVGIIEGNVQNRKGDFTQPSLQRVTVRACLYRFVKAFCKCYDIYFPFKEQTRGRQYIYQVGCAIMLTPDYFRAYQGLYSYTFLYGEEHILLVLLDRAGLDAAFAEDTYLIHMEGKSTPYSFLQGSRKKDKETVKGCWQALLASCMPYRSLARAASLRSK